MISHMLQRRGTASEWTTANPVLRDGEIGWIRGTVTFKIGDGVSHWVDLPIFNGSAMSITISDSPTVDLSLASGDLSAAVKLSADAGNQLEAGTDGALYVPTPAAPAQITRLDLSRSGTLTVANGIAKVWFNHAGTVNLARVGVGTPPAGSPINVRFKKNGAGSWFTMSIAAGSDTTVDNTLSLAVVAGDYATVDVTQIGSVDAGAYLTATLEVTS